MLKAMLYKGCMVYLRLIDNEIFEWMLVFNNQIYSSYMIMKPAKGKDKLSKTEIDVSAGIVWMGATATIDTLKGEGLDQLEKNANKEFRDRGKLIRQVASTIN